MDQHILWYLGHNVVEQQKENVNCWRASLLVKCLLILPGNLVMKQIRFSCYLSDKVLCKQPLMSRGRANALSVFTQKMEDKLEEVLREFKSLRDRVILQDRRIARLEEQVAKVAM